VYVFQCEQVIKLRFWL